MRLSESDFLGEEPQRSSSPSSDWGHCRSVVMLLPQSTDQGGESEVAIDGGRRMSGAEVEEQTAVVLLASGLL